MYISRGPSQVRIWKEVDPVSRQIMALHAEWLRSIDNAYYMDGRPRPSEFAAHTWGGFSTARIRGRHAEDHHHASSRKITYRRNGVPSSDLHAHPVLDPARRLPDLGEIAYDPVYLTEPMIRSTEYPATLNQQIPPYPCDVVEEVVRPKGDVPHYMPGANPFLGEFGKKYNLPLEVTMGGADTMYPEAARKMIRAANGEPPKK